MSNKNLDRQVMEQVLGWRHGVGLKGGGCRPVDAKPTPVVPKGQCYAGCEMGSVGGTYPFFYGEHVFFDKKGCGISFHPSESLDDAMSAMEARGFQIELVQRLKGSYEVVIVDTLAKPRTATGRGKTLAQALCHAMINHAEVGEKLKAKKDKLQ